MSKRISGNKEWAVHNVNCITGCEHNCRYCYARYNAVKRFKLTTEEEWPVPQVREHDVKKKRHKKEGTIMFPTTHDITPAVVEPCLEVLNKLLEAGNDVLIVSKPHIEVMIILCHALSEYKEKILFRFTIGAIDDIILGYWEPNAPKFVERLACLRYAFEHGFKTSVSIEPMLDADHIIELCDQLEPFVTDAIWIGKMDKIDQRVLNVEEKDMHYVIAIQDGQTDAKIKAIFKSLHNRSKIKWKEPIKEVVGLPLSEEAGADM